MSWKGTLIQYTGRLHRLHPAKKEGSSGFGVGESSGRDDVAA
jgi:hypothetical protein